MRGYFRVRTSDYLYCIDGNCLLLDDGEEHSCVQLISMYGIYCNYLLKCVLPAFPKLYGDIIAYNEKLKG